MLERGRIADDVHVAIESVKEPECRIRGVIEAFVVSLGKQIWDQAVAYVLGERAKQISGLEVPPRRQREPLEADHRVASPVSEPMIACHDAADLVACSFGARGVLDAADRRDDELIGG